MLKMNSFVRISASMGIGAGESGAGGGEGVAAATTELTTVGCGSANRTRNE
jgi:hypothetical protein